MDYADGMNFIQQVSQYNNAWSAEQAQKQMDFEERMSNTSHQREVADLRAAGLNPVLSANSAGATTPAGAMGSTDTSLTSAMYGLVKQALDAQMVSAEAVASVASSASGSRNGSGSIQNKIKNGLESLFGSNNSALNEAKAQDKFEQDREAKRRDTAYQQSLSYKVLGIPVGLLLNEAAERKGYETWPEMVADEIETVANYNTKVPVAVKGGIESAKKKSQQSVKKNSNSSKKKNNIRHSYGKF